MSRLLPLLKKNSTIDKDSHGMCLMNSLWARHFSKTKELQLMSASVLIRLPHSIELPCSPHSTSKESRQYSRELRRVTLSTFHCQKQWLVDYPFQKTTMNRHPWTKPQRTSRPSPHLETLRKIIKTWNYSWTTTLTFWSHLVRSRCQPTVLRLWRRTKISAIWRTSSSLTASRWKKVSTVWPNGPKKSCLTGSGPIVAPNSSFHQ